MAFAEASPDPDEMPNKRLKFPCRASGAIKVAPPQAWTVYTNLVVVQSWSKVSLGFMHSTRRRTIALWCV